MKHMKRLNKMLSLLLAIAMLLSITVAVEATGGSFSIEVTNASDNETYYAYKIFDAVTNGSNYSYTIDEDSPFLDAILGATDNGQSLYGLLELEESTADPGIYVVTYKGTTEADKTAFTTAMISIIKGVLESSQSIDYDGSATVAYGENSVEISGLYAGYYYVSTTVGTVVSLGSVSTIRAVIEDKNEEPYVEKTVYDGPETDENQILDDTSNWDDANDAGVGDTVYFTTKIYHLADIETLVLHDTMDAGLTYGSIVSVKLYSDTSDTDPATLSENTDYTMNNSITDGCTFEMNFANLLSSTNTNYSNKVTGASDPDAAYIEVIYKATINSNAVIYSADGTPNSNNNSTYVEFGDNSESEKSTTKTYVYSLNIYKYTGESVAQGTALSGATFYIYKEVDGDVYYAVLTGNESPYTLTDWTGYIGEATEITTTDTGLLQIKGLDEGTYKIHETAAPTGYNPLTSDVEFYIAGESENGKTQGAIYGSSTSGNTITESVEVQNVTYTAIPIKNSTGTELPGTGGIGTTIFYVVGGVLVVGAIVLLITKKRLGNKEDE